MFLLKKRNGLCQKYEMIKNVLLWALMTLISLNLASQDAYDLYHQSTDLFNQKKYELALWKVDKAIELDSVNEYYYYHKGMILFFLNKYEEALLTLDKSMQLLPESALLNKGKGLILFRIDKIEEAILFSKKAIDLSNNEEEIFTLKTLIADAKRQLRQFDEAYIDLLELNSIKPNNVMTLVSLGTVCDNMGKRNKALEYFKRAIELDSTSMEAYGNIGFILQQEGEYEKSIYYFDRVLKLSPNDPLAYNNRSFSKLKIGDIDGAFQDIELAINLLPSNSYAFKNQGLIYLEIGEAEKACINFQKAIDKGYSKFYGDDLVNIMKVNCK